MARCFATRQLPGTALERLAAIHELDVWPERLPPSYAELGERLQDIEGLLSLLTDRVDAELIERSKRLRAISNYAAGYDNIDLRVATARRIPVGHTPDVLTEATADLTFALLLAAARKLPDAIESARTGDWLTWGPAAHLGHEVGGATLGIVGLGRIGRAVAKRARGFDMRVIHARAGAESQSAFETVLEESDFLSLHCPLTAETHHLIDGRALSKMRRTAILINTARGPIVDQPALREALIDGTIAGAALDVTDPEPLPVHDPLLDAPNLIVTPHIGSATRVARERMAELAVDNLVAGLAGRPMPHQANPAS